MIEWFTQTAASLAEFPLLQGVVAAFATFILEDPTTIACGFLVADGKLSFQTALIGVSSGIALGDFGLYGIGRLIGPKTLSWGLLSQERIRKAQHMFERNLVVAVVVSRFLPGMRLPTYMGAGVFGASALRFLAVAVGASLLWTFLLLSATLKFGEAVLPLLGDLKWPVAAAFVVLFLVIRKLGSKAMAKKEDDDDEVAEARPVASVFEFWPPSLFYVPVAVYYLGLALRYRSLTLPTLANPSIYSGGMIGESKSGILDLIPEERRQWVCRYTTFSCPAVETPMEELMAGTCSKLAEAGLAFPFVMKPDVGQRGAGVRLIRTEHDLRCYLESCPPGERFILQEFADLPSEMGVLYYRIPGESRGTLFSVTRKRFPVVRGDGVRTLRELILADPRASLFTGVYFHRHASKLDLVLADGEEFRLVFAGNHCQGAVFENANYLASGPLRDVVEDLVQGIPEFYFGRFDIRFKDLRSLLEGRDFRIIEINGAGAEATHIWDASMTLPSAYRTLFDQFKILFRIGYLNRRRGFKTLGPIQFLNDCMAYRKIARQYPETL